VVYIVLPDLSGPVRSEVSALVVEHVLAVKTPVSLHSSEKAVFLLDSNGIGGSVFYTLLSSIIKVSI
jgi:hypothetical protein